MESKLPYYSEAGTFHGKNSLFDPRLGGRALKSSQFTTKISNHGLWRDTSITAATREKKQHEVVLKRKHGAMDKLSAQFERETKRVEKLQRQLAESQNEMAFIAMTKYTSTYLQSVVRGWLGRIRWYRVHKLRLLRQWLTFRIYFRKRQKAWRKIRKCIFHYIGKKRLIAIRMYLTAVRRVQLQYRMRYRQKMAVVRVKSLLFWNDAKHLAIARAKLKLSKFERAKAAMRTVMHGFIRRQRQRRLGNPQGYNRIFYSLFFYPIDQLKRINGDASNRMANGSKSIAEEEEEGAEDKAVESKHTPLNLEQLEQKIQLVTTLKSSKETMSFIRQRAEKIRAKRSPTKAAGRMSTIQKAHSSPSPVGASGGGGGGAGGGTSTKAASSLLRRANSQLDTVSLLKNEFNTKAHRNTIVPTPYALRGTFRIRSIYDAVILLQDLAVRASLNPELVGSSLELNVGTAEDERSPVARKGVTKTRTMSIKPFADYPLPETPAPSVRAVAGVKSTRRPSATGSNSSGPVRERKVSGSGNKGLGIPTPQGSAPGRRKQSVFGPRAGTGNVINTNVVSSTPPVNAIAPKPSGTKNPLSASSPAPRRRGSVITAVSTMGALIPKPPPIITSVESSSSVSTSLSENDTTVAATLQIAPSNTQCETSVGESGGLQERADDQCLSQPSAVVADESGLAELVARDLSSESSELCVQIRVPNQEIEIVEITSSAMPNVEAVKVVSADILAEPVVPLTAASETPCEDSKGENDHIPIQHTRQQILVTTTSCPEDTDSSSSSDSEGETCSHIERQKMSSQNERGEEEMKSVADDEIVSGAPVVVSGAASIRQLSITSKLNGSRASSTYLPVDAVATDAKTALVGESITYSVGDAIATVASLDQKLIVAHEENSDVYNSDSVSKEDEYGDDDYEEYDEDFEEFEESGEEHSSGATTATSVPKRPVDPKPSSASFRRNRGEVSTNQ